MTKNKKMALETQNEVIKGLEKPWLRARNLVFCLVLLMGLILFVPWHPIPLTFYYEYCMHLATDQGWQFGTDIISTYGPLGFIGLPFYRPFTYPSMIVSNICLYGIMVAFLWEFWRSTVKSIRPSAIWIVFILLLPGCGPAAEWSPVLFVPYILVNLFVLQHFLEKSSPSWIYLVLLVFVLGIFLLVKGSFIFLILLCVGVVSVDQITKSRQMPWIIPGFIISVLILWVASNQKAGHILDYLLNSADLIAGYKDGMGSGEGTKLGILPLIFAAGSLGLVGTFFLVIRKRLGWRSLWPTSVFAATLFVIFQHGFVRQDPEHSVPACLTFCSLSALVIPLLWHLSDGNRQLRRGVVANGLTGIIIVVICWLSDRGTPVLSILFQRANGLPSLMTQGVLPLKTARETHMQSLKKNFRIPKLNGSLESCTVDAGLAEAYGYHSSIRPTVTIYAANTSKMSRRNKDYLEDTSGPTTILFSTQPGMDGRYPAAADSIGLLAQKTHFSAVGSVGGILILERRAKPLKLQSQKIQELNVNFNEVISVPNPGRGMIFAQFEVEPTLAGKLFSILYKPAATFITVNVAGQETTFRLIKSTAKEGIILSPPLYNLPTFQAFYSDSESGLKLSSFRIEYEKCREWCYHNKIKVVLSKAETE